LVDVDVDGGQSMKTLSIRRKELLALNQRHAFFGHDKNSLSPLHHFEDGIKCNYTSILSRARFCEIALALDGIACNIDFTDDAAAVKLQQLKCVEMCVIVMNITCLYLGVDRRRESRSQDVSRLITYGQGHCHGLTSTLSAVLLPFAPLIGIDLHYRKGDHFSNSSSQFVSNKVDRHHWLELVSRPSMDRYIADLTLFAQDISRFSSHSELFLPASLAYSIQGGVYPHSSLPDFVKTAPLLPTDCDFKVVES